MIKTFKVVHSRPARREGGEQRVWWWKDERMKSLSARNRVNGAGVSRHVIWTRPLIRCVSARIKQNTTRLTFENIRYSYLEYISVVVLVINTIIMTENATNVDLVHRALVLLGTKALFALGETSVSVGRERKDVLHIIEVEYSTIEHRK